MEVEARGVQAELAGEHGEVPGPVADVEQGSRLRALAQQREQVQVARGVFGEVDLPPRPGVLGEDVRLVTEPLEDGTRARVEIRRLQRAGGSRGHDAGEGTASTRLGPPFR